MICDFKKKMILGFATLTAVLLMGCGSAGDDAKTTESTGEQTQEATGSEATDAAATADAATTAEQDYESVFVFDFNPDDYVSLADYTKLSIEVKETVVDEAYVTAIENQIFNSAASSVSSDNLITDRAVENGDLINLSYVGKKDGVAFDGGTADGTTLLIGSGSYIEGFESGLVGVMCGDTVDLDLTFPENYSATELAGAAVVFTVTVNGIIPADDIYAHITEVVGITTADGGTIDSKEKLHDFAYEYVKTYYSNGTDVEMETAQKLRTESKYVADLPDNLIEAYRGRAKKALADYAADYSMTEEDFAQNYFGMSAAEYVDDYTIEQVEMDMALYAVAIKESLVLTDEELMSRIKEQAPNATDDQLTEEMIGTFRTYFMEMDVMSLLAEKVEQIIVPAE